ncbi:MAG: Fe-S cluster assembly protein SufD [Alphaproteobacteria bacterium]|nr:Fe-S cluster assembly protein SufD [Alphaproteobacteria bacterium]
MTLAALIEESHTQREAWHYTNLAPFADLALKPMTVGPSPVLPKALSRHRLVFVDGFYRAELSSMEDLPHGFISLCDTTDTCCSLALSGQTCLAIDPVELLFVSSPQQNASEATTTIQIALGENSRLTVIERHVGLGDGVKAHHVVMDIDLAAQAKLVHGKVLSGDNEALHFARTKVNVAAGAFYDHFGLIAGGKLMRCEADVSLNGELAEARMFAIQLLRGTQHGDITTRIRHEAPHTASRQICKAVLAEKAHGVFQGKIYVAKGAQKTDGYQLCRALLLSDKAEMDAKPELEIFADDVKCSHGATIGDLDENALFYLISRGIDPATARAMLVDAFVGELADQLSAGALQSAIQEEVTAWLA